MVPAGSDRVSRARPYSGTAQGSPNAFAYGTIALYGETFQSLQLTLGFVTPPPAGRRMKHSPTTPTQQRLPSITLCGFGLFPFRSPLLRESRFLSFPRATKMFQFARLPPLALFDSGKGTRALPRVGFPIRRSRDRRLVSTFPGLIAAAHVLLRLLAPRHPPCALILLIEKNTCLPLWSFQGARELAPALHEKNQAAGSVSQNSTACEASYVEVDVVLGDPVDRTVANDHRRVGSPQSLEPNRSRAPDSLERR